MSSETEYWDILSNYESAELVRRQFTAKHGRSLNAGKAREICTSFVQARGYMSAAQAADRNVRPLLVYYGVLSMSRALTLFRTPSLREAGLAHAHGLSVENWGQELSRDGGDVAALKVKFGTQGTFHQLIAATEHKSLLRSNSSNPNHTCKLDVPPSDSSFTLAELLSRLPEIRATYERWRSDRNTVGIWPQKKRPDGSLELRIEFGTREDVKAILGDLEVMEKSGNIFHVVAPPALDIPYLSDVTQHWYAGRDEPLSERNQVVEDRRGVCYLIRAGNVGAVLPFPMGRHTPESETRCGTALPDGGAQACGIRLPALRG